MIQNETPLVILIVMRLEADISSFQIIIYIAVIIEAAGCKQLFLRGSHDTSSQAISISFV